MDMFASEYDDFILFINDFKLNKTAYVYDKDEKRWLLGVVTYCKDTTEYKGTESELLSEANSEWSGEFITDHSSYYIGIGITFKCCLDATPNIRVIQYC